MAGGDAAIKKLRTDHWGILIGAIVLTLASALFGQSDAGKGAGAPSGSTYSQRDDGLWAVYQALSDRPGQVRQWELPPRRLPPEVDRLVIWQPGDVTAAAWQQVLDWVGQGNRLLISVDSSNAVDDAPGDSASKAAGSTWAQRLSSGRTAARSAGIATPVAVHPASLGVTEVAVGSGVFREAGDTLLVHLARADGTPVLVSWPHGQGRIFWSADANWLTNAQIGQADNLRLALGLLTPGPDKQLAFDEYHHGFRAAQHWYEILRGPLRSFALQLALALALLYWAWGARFGAPRPVAAGLPRAAVEYVTSMGRLYRRARARPVVREALYRSLLTELGHLTGGVRGLDHAEMARRAAAQARLPVGALLNLLDRLAPEGPPPDSDAKLLALAREAEAIQRRVRHARHRDQGNAAADSGRTR